jgi:hypothetical protein
MSYTTTKSKAIFNHAGLQAQAYPASALLAHVLGQHQDQDATLGGFIDEVVKRITTALVAKKHGTHQLNHSSLDYADQGPFTVG